MSPCNTSALCNYRAFLVVSCSSSTKKGDDTDTACLRPTLTCPLTSYGGSIGTGMMRKTESKNSSTILGQTDSVLSGSLTTEVEFRFIMIAYNLTSLFQQIVLREKNQSILKTVRFKCFALEAWITRYSHRMTPTIVQARKKRMWLDGLFSVARATVPPYRCE